MKRSSVFIWILVLIFFLGVLSFIHCENENSPAKLPPGATPQVDEMPPTSDLLNCVPFYKLPSLLTIVEPIVSGLSISMLDKLSDPMFLLELEIMGVTLKDIVCDKERFDPILLNIAHYIDTQKDREQITIAIVGLLVAYVDWDAVDISAALALQEFEAKEIACLGEWLSKAIIYLQSEEGQQWVYDTVEQMIVDLNIDQLLYDAGISFLKPFIEPVIEAIPEEVMKLVNTLVSSLLADGEPDLIRLLREAETHMPTPTEIIVAITKLIPVLVDKIIPALVDFCFDLLEKADYTFVTPALVSLFENPDILRDILLIKLELGECSE